jgi:hypothetical protein
MKYKLILLLLGTVILVSAGDVDTPNVSPAVRNKKVMEDSCKYYHNQARLFNYLTDQKLRELHRPDR